MGRHSLRFPRTPSILELLILRIMERNGRIMSTIDIRDRVYEKNIGLGVYQQERAIKLLNGDGLIDFLQEKIVGEKKNRRRVSFYFLNDAGIRKLEEIIKLISP